MSPGLAASAAAAANSERPEIRAIATFPTGPSRALWRLCLVSCTLLVAGLACSLPHQPALVSILALLTLTWLVLRGRGAFRGLVAGTLVLLEDASVSWFDDGGVRGGPLEPTASVSLAGVLFMQARLEGSPCWLCLSRAESRPDHWLMLRRWLLWRQRGGKPARPGLESTTSTLS